MITPFLALRAASIGRTGPIKDLEVQKWLACLLDTSNARDCNKGEYRSSDNYGGSIPVWEFSEAHPLTIGVSGGADSVLLAYLLSKVVDKSKLRGLVVEHGLRPESKSEANLTINTLLDLGIDSSLLNLKWDKEGEESYRNLNESTKLEPGTMNYYPGKVLPVGSRLEVVAREARYSAMTKAMGYTNSRILALGHHNNDLTETFLFRFFRESGLGGLSGINPLRMIPPSLVDMGSWPNYDCVRKFRMFRPMLMVPKSRIYETCKYHGLRWVEDPTNVCSTSLHQRTVIRKEMNKWEADPRPELAALKVESISNMVARYTEHNRSINQRILELAEKEIQLFTNYGICRLKVPLKPPADHWLNNIFMSSRILAILAKWIACSDYAPGLGQVQTAHAAMLGKPSSHISSDKTGSFMIQIGNASLLSPSKKNPFWTMCRTPGPQSHTKTLIHPLELLSPEDPSKPAPAWNNLWDNRFLLSISAKRDLRDDKFLLLWAKLFIPGITSLPLGEDRVQFLIRPLDQELITSSRNKHTVFGSKLPPVLKKGLKETSYALFNLQKNLSMVSARSTLPVLVMRIHTVHLAEFGPSQLADSKHRFVDVPLAFPTLNSANIFPDIFLIKSSPAFPPLSELLES